MTSNETCKSEGLWGGGGGGVVHALCECCAKSAF